MHQNETIAACVFTEAVDGTTHAFLAPEGRDGPADMAVLDRAGLLQLRAQVDAALTLIEG